MRFDRILGAISMIVGLAVIAFFVNAIQVTAQQPNSDLLASLVYPYIAFGILLTFVGLYFLGRPKEDASHPSAVNSKNSEEG